MRATGIVRRIDDLGRVVIPKELRRTLRISTGHPLEVYTDRDGRVILKKYSPMVDLSFYAGDYAKSLHEATNYITLIVEDGRVISGFGLPKKSLERLSLDGILDQASETQTQLSTTPDTETGFISYIVSPIQKENHLYGYIVLASQDAKKTPGAIEQKLVETASSFLSQQMSK